MKKKILTSLLVIMSMICMLLPQSVLAKDNWSVSALGTDFDDRGSVAESGVEGEIYGVTNGAHASYTFYLPESGNYKITTLSSDLNGDNYVSPVKMTVNGTVVTPTKVSGSTTGVTSTVYADLAAGENTIDYMINGPKGSNAAQYLMYINKVTVEHIPAIEDAASFYVEGEKMTGGGTVVNGTYNAGSMLSLWGLFGTVTLTYDITLNEASDYILSEFVALALYSYTAPWTLSVNGTDYFVRGETANTGISSAGAYNNIGVEKVTTDIVVPFVKGTNTVKIVVSSASNGINTMIDYLKFTKVEKTESLWFEGPGVVNKAANAIASDPHKYTYSVDIPEDMSVHLVYRGRQDIGYNDASKYYGNLKIQLDGEDLLTASTDTMSYSNADSDGVADYTTKESISLDEGPHTFTFITDTQGSLQTGVWCFMDFVYFELIPADSAIEILELTADAEMIKEGETANLTAKAKDQYGLIVSDSKINSTVWSIDNENLAEISQDGVLTAYNPGVVTVTVTVNDEYTATEEISIYGEGGLIIIGGDVDENGKTIVKFTKAPGVADALAPFDVIIGTYGEVDGVQTTLSNVSVSEDVEAREGRIKKVEATGMTNDSVSVFVWDSLSGMNPLTAAALLK